MLSHFNFFFEAIFVTIDIHFVGSDFGVEGMLTSLGHPKI